MVRQGVMERDEEKKVYNDQDIKMIEYDRERLEL